MVKKKVLLLIFRKIQKIMWGNKIILLEEINFFIIFTIIIDTQIQINKFLVYSLIRFLIFI